MRTMIIKYLHRYACVKNDREKEHDYYVKLFMGVLWTLEELFPKLI